MKTLEQLAANYLKRRGYVFYKKPTARKPRQRKAEFVVVATTDTPGVVVAAVAPEAAIQADAELRRVG